MSFLLLMEVEVLRAGWMLWFLSLKSIKQEMELLIKSVWSTEVLINVVICIDLSTVGMADIRCYNLWKILFGPLNQSMTWVVSYRRRAS